MYTRFFYFLAYIVRQFDLFLLLVVVAEVEVLRRDIVLFLLRLLYLFVVLVIWKRRGAKETN